MNMRNGTFGEWGFAGYESGYYFFKGGRCYQYAFGSCGGTFFPEYPVFRWIGRLAFPIFCYCMTVGMLYTRDIKRYLGRIAVFAVISQPFWILAFNPHDFWGI